MINTDSFVETDKQWKVSLEGKNLKFIYIKTDALAKKAVERLLNTQNTAFGFDIETGKAKNYRSDPVSGLCPYRSFPSLLQFYDGIETVYMFDCLFVSPKIIAPLFERRIIAHNAIFDLQHMKHNKIASNFTIDCSMIMYNMTRCAEYASLEEEDNALEEEWQGHEGEGVALDWLGKGERYGASLRVCVAKLLGIEVEKDLQVSNWTDRPLYTRQLIYAAKDAYFTYEIGKILSNKLADLNMSNIYILNRNALNPVTDMILNGCFIDTKLHREHIKKWAKRKDELHVEILKYFGRESNIRSTVQISSWLEKNLPLDYQHKWTRSEKTGRLKSDAQTLSKFSDLPYVAPLLEYKKLDKLLNTYGETMLEKICPVTGRLHGSFTLAYTATGRMSSRNPNLQNLPRGADLRGIFRAPKTKLLVGADYGQIEVRVAALLSKDPKMLHIYKNGLDMHAVTAAALTGKTKVTKNERQLAKACVFGLLFGLGAKGLVEYANWNYGVKMHLDDAYNYVYTFFDTYKGYSQWQAKQRSFAQSEGYVKTKLGKVRKLSDIGSYTRSVNHPVQGSAAEVVITALYSLHKKLKGSKIKLTNCVHDEILLEAPEGEVNEASKILKDTMEKAMLSVFPKASLNKLVDVKNGKTWAELK